MAKLNNTWVNIGIMCVIVACLAVTAFVGYTMYGQNAKAGDTTNTNPNGQAYQSTCELGTSVQVTASKTDVKQSGTAVGGTLWASVNGGAYGTTITPEAVGATIDYLNVNATTYHSSIVTGMKVPCSATMTVPVTALANSSLTMTVYNQYGTATLTNGGGTNLSLASGESATAKIMLQAENLKGTQKMRCVLESSNTSKAKTMKLEGFGATVAARPSFYSVGATSSVTWAFDVNSIEGAAPVDGYIYMEPKTSQDLSGSNFKVTCYTYEYFLDSTTGKVVFDIEDSAGNMKSIGVYTGTYYID